MATLFQQNTLRLNKQINRRTNKETMVIYYSKGPKLISFLISIHLFDYDIVCPKILHRFCMVDRFFAYSDD